MRTSARSSRVQRGAIIAYLSFRDGWTLRRSWVPRDARSERLRRTDHARSASRCCQRKPIPTPRESTPLTPGRNHGHVNGSAAELPRRGAVWHIDVQTAFAYCAARIENPVRSVVRRSSRNPNARSERQHRRIRSDDTFRDGDARCGNTAGAVRSRRKQ
jgi:hypothetical protein